MINTEIELPYGRKRIQLRIPKRNLLGIITSEEQIPISDPCKKIEKALEQDLVNGNFFYTKELSNKFLEKTLVTPINSIQETIDKVLSENPKIKIAVLPEGPYTTLGFYPF
jgi:hypothetical protein